MIPLKTYKIRKLKKCEVEIWAAQALSDPTEAQGPRGMCQQMKGLEN
jgi:hypothetical protein